MKLMLDVDGVILAKVDGKVAAAPHLSEFIDFALGNFECFWLSTHCSGSAESVLDYLRPFVTPEVLVMMEKIKPITFKLLKTEAVDRDSWWLEDQPMLAEMRDLQRRGLTDRWIEVNTRLRPDDLLHALDELKRVLGKTN